MTNLLTPNFLLSVSIKILSTLISLHPTLFSFTLIHTHLLDPHSSHSYTFISSIYAHLLHPQSSHSCTFISSIYAHLLHPHLSSHLIHPHSSPLSIVIFFYFFVSYFVEDRSVVRETFF